VEDRPRRNRLSENQLAGPLRAGLIPEDGALFCNGGAPTQLFFWQSVPSRER
jgi:hypothetical protein